MWGGKFISTTAAATSWLEKKIDCCRNVAKSKNPPSRLRHACVGVIARAIKGLPNHSDYQCSYKGKIQTLSLSLKDMLWFLLQQGKSSKLFFANVANDSTKDLQSVSNFIELDEFISTTKWYSPVRFVNFYSHKILHQGWLWKTLKTKKLRGALQLAELEREGGFASHVSPYVQAQDLGSLLNRSGFNMVTLDTDEVTIRVPTVMQLIRDLKGKVFRPLQLLLRYGY